MEQILSIEVVVIQRKKIINFFVHKNKGLGQDGLVKTGNEDFTKSIIN